VSTAEPLVTLGVPVRNGAATLAAALDAIVKQDFKNLEVIISDNASTDATPEIAQNYAARYPFIRIVRPKAPLTAIDNFLFVMNHAKGEFFAWCADDDTRSPDFVSGLLPAFKDPATALAFGDLYICDGTSPPQYRRDYDFCTKGMPLVRRLHKTASMQCYHAYGLWRLSILRAIRNRYTHWWSDLPLMLAASALGEFRYLAGPRFYYYENLANRKQTTYRRINNFYSLFSAIVVTVWRTAGPLAAAASVTFVMEKYVRVAFHRLGIALGASP
jgi:glycosyltransferase involved in cell wall biosynthesis